MSTSSAARIPDCVNPLHCGNVGVLNVEIYMSDGFDCGPEQDADTGEWRDIDAGDFVFRSFDSIHEVEDTFYVIRGSFAKAKRFAKKWITERGGTVAI